ncbi:MAG: alcohol dehydrogenase catalytic domain-containing protein, partial [Chloroflexota bacterium]
MAVRQVAVPRPGREEVLVQTEWSAVSPGTERWLLTDRFFSRNAPGTRFPAVPGYQRVGTIQAVGPGVDSVRVGQR